MIIKVEMIVNTTKLCDSEYESEPQKKTQAQFLLDEIKSNLEFDGLYEVIFAEAYETNHDHPVFRYGINNEPEKD